MTNDGGISVGYVGVHAAYQVALAAEEMGRLDRFYCSLLDAPGKWGGLLYTVLGSKRLASRRVPGLPPERVIENPWPFLKSSARTALHQARPDEWLRTCDTFDRWLATQLEQSDSRVFYGIESCAERALGRAREKGMLCVIECPGVHPKFMQNILAEASGTPGKNYLAAPMTQRKLRTHSLADVLVTHSEIHTHSFLMAGVPREQIFECPLWVDPELFHSMGRVPRIGLANPLRVLFAGRVTMLKGIPWLWEALRRVSNHVQLTVVGSANAEGRELLRRAPSNVTYRPAVTKAVLRNIYQSHDVLVLPSLIDSFGFVALEAMACGLPVILTDHCGAPVPDESWRVPVRDSAAIAERLTRYAEDREQLARDGERAATFAREHTPKAFRARIADRFQTLLSASNSPKAP